MVPEFDQSRTRPILLTAMHFLNGRPAFRQRGDHRRIDRLRSKEWREDDYPARPISNRLPVRRSSRHRPRRAGSYGIN